MQGRALFDAVKLLIEQTQLRQKLASLPREDFTDLKDELDTLLALAAEAETRGTTFADFAEKLRSDFLLQRDVRRSTDGGIQLITAQKAKGSEWQAVILPFLGRGVIPPSPRYPCVIKIPGSNESLVALTKDDFPDEVRSATKTAVQQETARLLYVATTRARHTLVLALDEEIFARANGEPQNGAQLKCLLGEKQINRPHFDTLDVEPVACPKTAQAREQAIAGPEAQPQPLARIDRKALKVAKVRAASFVHKFNPSGYDEEILQASVDTINDNMPALAVGRSTADTPATLYGRWWHDFVQRISWRDESLWKQMFEEYQAKSPAPKRSADEWELFLRCLKNGPDFSDRLIRAESLTHAEMPFFWRMDEGRCLEGIVDLALFEPTENKWFILDWKTNREEIDTLRARYRPQLAAYRKVIGEMTGHDVSAAIYSTANGEFLKYEPDELATEWERLQKLPATQLLAELADA
jgi:ATP-dependent exoDNAse (exonuclease V) beta subunit